MQIDFYIIQSASASERALFSCRLTEKIWRLGHTIVIRTESAGQSAQLDEQLWTFRPGSFIPHNPLNSNAGLETRLPSPTENEAHTGNQRLPVLLSHDDASLTGYQIVINLKPDAIPVPDQFSRIVELIDQDPDRLIAGRRRYQQYQRQGHELITHNI